MPATSPSRSDRLVALRRQIILDAAQRVFARDGLDRTTIRAIAKEAGCTTGAIYPWFDGKEAIYAAVLRESLDRLDRHLQVQVQAGPRAKAARRVIQAFFDYYAERGTEFSLGMYLFQGLGPRGLGRDTDEELNRRLRACVDRLGDGLKAAGWSPEDVPCEQMNVFTYLMGLLLLFHTHRLKSLNQQAQPLLDRYCDALEQRRT